MSADDPRDGQEFNEFLFGPREREDGSTPTGPEEKRRQQAIEYHLQRLAKKHGVTVEQVLERPVEPTGPTDRAKKIRAGFDAMAPEAEARARTRFQSQKVTLPDGTEASSKTFDLGCLDTIAEAIKSVVTPAWPGKLAGKSISLAVRCGRFVSTTLEATNRVESKPEEHAPVEERE